ncbi:hypothetical protein GTA62_16985 [Roseobacter sp. HKCCD9010]|uniref:hypothetical protein n=1 Tax=unclassified Roseobacter TaxID=196798 RepID=UPI001492F710|nr:MULTISPECIES: hypothetical protein [unclassified Roseobacter]MBF9051559.1 hypothetical protein [Rhodobacterales bacterium HKCCD4356]NNV13083.1 hypothetical protein [Roseobacter sp. HKCCD7357]NNV17334.1 hypothetical protein [Roseobacter sp. HKCCD8768]NNV26940.1 hypothetical protein [Roseobacter sp. HKCCD8192]NNV31060.1 hypothetical protein [Roseobacter sp. HKCCD9061]
MNEIDPNLPGIWIVPGEAFTYEILPDGSYHVATPPAALTFSEDATVMTWDGSDYVRQSGSGKGVEGHWMARDAREDWLFSNDGRYQLRLGDDSPALTGIWALRNGGTQLWTRERLAQLVTDGAQVTFQMQGEPSITYGYTVSDGVWVLMDPVSWERRATYRRP